MPNFWHIPELVHLVVSFLSKSDQASFARVNRRLWLIAVLEIWRAVPDLRYFFLLLPADLCLWSSGSEVGELSKPIFAACPLTLPPQSYPASLRRQIHTSDYDRLIFHSRFTENLHYKVNKAIFGVPAEIWHHNTVSTAFPHLQSLHVSVNCWVTLWQIIMLSPFLQPTLRKLVFSSELDQLSSTLRTIFETRTLSLQELELNCLRGVEEFVESARQAILSQRSLRRIRIYSLGDVTNLAYTAKELPCLTHFDVERLWSAPESVSKRRDQEDGPERHFRSLVSLRVSGIPAGVTKLLESITSNVITEIVAELGDYRPGWMPPGALLALHAFKATLINLELQIRGNFKWDLLEPVLGLDGLQKFSLTYTTSTISPQVTDSRLLQMTQAWPRLTSLHLSNYSKTPTITLLGLGYIASNSQKLQVLSVAFDGTRLVDPACLPVDDPPPEQSAMERVDVLHSRCKKGDELKITTSFFRRWWPRARITASDMLWGEEEEWERASAASRTA
ncbi:hypothetical protein FRC01_000765 [Tulasnella sp. 417]|nr:hypothetical protein FRC01_000765 [Tulasnella sp. 417]